MKKDNKELISWLFETKAVKVCPQDKPFWYTSGTIGPYYVNTHFLYGSQEKAEKLLEIIDREKAGKSACSSIILSELLGNYENDPVYNGLINNMVEFIRNNIDLDEIDYISGGERRDWFFSLIIANILKKPHITVFKDLSTYLFNNGKSEELKNIKGKRVLHTADIITEASSYTRAWVPAIRQIGGNMQWSLVVVDRLQGGAENLAAEGVKSFALTDINKSLFDLALEMEYINREQYEMIVEFIKNPKESMRQFLMQHPGFLKTALQGDDKTRERARMCIEKNLYQLDQVVLDQIVK